MEQLTLKDILQCCGIFRADVVGVCDSELLDKLLPTICALQRLLELRLRAAVAYCVLSGCGVSTAGVARRVSTPVLAELDGQRDEDEIFYSDESANNLSVDSSLD